ncbi:MAG: hypothetical protein R2741_00160 [Methanolobus sp.]
MKINNTLHTETIPQDLKEFNQWVLWKSEQKDNGGTTKIPYSKNGFKANFLDPAFWMNFEDAYATYINSNGRYSGVGFVFTESDPFIGFDWDHVCESTGEFEPDILEEIKSLNSYAEISQSGEGAHVIAKGEVPGSKNRKGRREIYDKDRFFVVTGNHIDDTPLTINEAPVDAVSAIYFRIDTPSMEVESVDELKPRITDIEVIEKCRNASNGTLFNQLYNGDWKSVGKYSSQSEADLALCNLLAVQTDNPKQMDRIFIWSGLYRDKWDRLDYKDRTISKALEGALAMKINPREKYFDGNRFIPKLLADDILSENHFFTLSDKAHLSLQ